MSIRGRTEFLDRPAYRQRRLRDAARGLPIFAIVLVMLPLMWPGGPGGAVRPSAMLVYVFGLWAVLAIIWFFLGRAIDPDLPEETGRAPATDPAPGQDAP